MKAIFYAIIKDKDITRKFKRGIVDIVDYYVDYTGNKKYDVMFDNGLKAINVNEEHLEFIKE